MEEGEVGEIDDDFEEGQYEPSGTEHRGVLSLEHNILFREMLEEHSGILKYVIKGEKSSSKYVKSVYEDFTMQFNERSGIELTAKQVKKKIGHLKQRAREEGSLLAGVVIKADSRIPDYSNDIETTPKKSLSYPTTRGSLGKKRKNLGSNDFTSDESFDPSFIKLKEEELAEARINTESTEVMLQCEKLRYEQECIMLETVKMKHKLARDEYHKRFGKYPNFDDGSMSPRDVKVEMLEDLMANHEESDVKGAL
eukprot:TRINITY_DN40054_c0_g1_i10.p1 TRINITY_DN40054_c0_g1~~TRINITY_DN40054_c0_g1_i10.p1  ORF type:complete len:268 (-),score=44.15 TRINITY_DN40054_c0_g1_i10:328-1086(-)